MDGGWLTGTELQLTRERSLKYKGTAKVYINQIVAHPSISRGLDPANVDRLCKIFNRDRCRRLDVRNHVTAVVSRQHLETALTSAGVSTIALMTNPPDRYPVLEFPVGQVQCLHGQHRLKAAEELLPPSDQWWTVDLYLDGGQDSDPPPSTALFCSSRYISSTLQAALVDEYSNEKVPSDGEVYLKVRQYQQEGNARFEERWMARLSANKAKRFRQLNSHVDVRAAFDRLRIIPALLLHGMKFGSIPRALATNCFEEMVHGLGSLLESWSYYVRGDRAKMLKIDPQTVGKLQGLAPSVSVKDKKVVKGLVLSGQVFSNFTSCERRAVWKRLKRRKGIIPSLHTFFQDMWYLEACANCLKRLVNPCQRYPSVKSAFLGVFKLDRNHSDCLIQTSETDFRHQRGFQTNRAELGYRQLWLYAMRHYPQMPREQSSDDLVAKPGHEKADEMILHDMAVLAQRLGFDSPHIQDLMQRSPDRQMARDILLKARKPERYQYPEEIFESLVTRICDCFSQAVSLDHPTSPEPALPREVKLKRYGLPHRNAQRQDSRLLFLDELHTSNVPLDNKVTTLFVRRCFYFAFFGQLPEASPLSPARPSSSSSDGSLPQSPILVPNDRSLAPISSGAPPIQRSCEVSADGQSRRDVTRPDRKSRKQEAKERRRKERRRRQELRRSRPPHDDCPTVENIDDYDMEVIPGPSVVHPERPESIEDERANMDVDSPIVTSNADQIDDEEMEESNGFHSDSERGSMATHVQFSEESEVAPDMADRALAGVFEGPFTEEALAQPAAGTPGDLEMRKQRELDHLQRRAEETVRDGEQGNRGAESPTTERDLSVRRRLTDVEDALEEGTMHLTAESSTDQAEARQESLQEALVETAERQDVGDIASTDRSDTPSQASNKKAMTSKEKRQGGIAMWASYDATTNRNHRADRGQRITRVDFTELELNSNQLSASNVLQQPANEVQKGKEAIRPRDRLVETEGLYCSEDLPAALGERTVPDIAIHSIVEEAGTSAAPFDPEAGEGRQNPSDVAPSEVRLTKRDDEKRMSERWEKRQSRLSRPMGIKKTKEKARAQDRQHHNRQGQQIRGPVIESSKAIPHQDGPKSRAEKVVTRINFEDLAKTMVQQEHEARSILAPEPSTTTEPRAETASPGNQPTTVVESSQAARARSTRKLLKPRIVIRPAREVRRVPLEPTSNSQSVTIIFRAQGDDGKWKTVHELHVNPSDPSEVERVARKEARNRNATFYDKNLRKLTPAQCFEAAIEDEINTIFIKFGGELVMDEETMASIARDIEL
ncbi:hypothetical protein CBS11350_10013 [Aspergillus niger]|nr:hypothetical protein CBS11350_10013 [Aspergillus niger]